MSYPVKQRLDLFGFQISIENPKGSKRTWHDPHSGESGTTYMHHAYGYIRRTEGTDGDHVDVYVGPNHASTRVFIVNQMKKPDFKEFDEQKVMLGWDRPEDAKSAYLKQYNNPKFFGSMTEMPLEEFRKKVLDKGNHGEKVADDSKRRDRLRKAGLISGMAALPLTAMAVRQLVKTPEAFPAWGLAASTAAGASAVLSHMAHAPKGKQEKDMPFKSKRQQRAAFAGAIPGISKEKAREWAHETPNIKGLPDRAPAEKGKPTLRSKESQFIKEAVSPQWIARGATGGMVQRFSKAGVTTHPDVARGIYRSIREGIPATDAAIQRFGQAVGGTTDQIAHEVRSGRRAFMKAALPPSSAVTPALHEQALSKIQGKVAQLAHAHDTGANLDEASVRRGMKVEMEHTKDQATARQIAIDHIRERPDYYEKLEAVEKKAAIDYFVELNLGKLAAGEAEVPASAVLGDKKKDQGIGDNIPPQTDFARAVEGDPIKAASESRASRIADHVDDVGLGLLGAPSAAYLTGSVLKRLPNAKAKALGHGLQHGVENLRHGTHHGIEAAGLALVSPTVSHAIAKKIDRMLPGEKKVATILIKEDMEELGRQHLRKALEKVASKYIPDFEYYTEEEKLAVLEHFGRLTKKADGLTPLMNAARRAGHAEAQVARRAVAARAPTVAVSPAATQFGGAARGYGPGGAQNFYPGGPVGHVQRPAVLNQASAPPPASAVQAAPQKAPRGYGAPAAQNFYPAGQAGHIERPASLNPPVAAPAQAPVAATVVPATTRRRLGWGAVPLGAGIAVGGVGVGAGMAAQGVASGLGTLAQQGGHEPIYGESFVGPGRLGT